jgi:hypothetical protein
MAMNLESRKGQIVWVEVDSQGKEKKTSRTFDLFTDVEADIKNALQGLVSLCNNTNALYYLNEKYEII